MSGFLTQDATGAHPAPAAADEPFLVVDGLSVRFPTHDGLVQAVTDLSYSVRRGQTLGIVGESGSGKSVSSMAVLGLHNPKQTRLEGSITVGGQEVIGADESTLRKLRGRRSR
jgi:peptide/nickel transport system ATP-binding protein